MFRVFASVLTVVMSLFAMPGLAIVEIEGSEQFRQQVENYLDKGRKISHHTRRLIDAVHDSARLIRILPITDDPKTWHRKGDSSRSHTRVVRLRDAERRQRPALRAMVYINPARISPQHKSYARGTLIHELVHALDLVRDQYHDDYVVREKRAVFFQNIWREAHGKRLRRHYHRKFNTPEYKQAVKQDRVEDFVNYYFEHDDLPQSGVNR